MFGHFNAGNGVLFLRNKNCAGFNIILICDALKAGYDTVDQGVGGF